MKEFFRKRLVALKRSPQNFALVALVIAFLYYALNLGNISSTTVGIQGPNMGLSEFTTMLFSILVFVCFLNSFPKRKQPNYVMIALMYVIFAVIVIADLNYRVCIINGIYDRADMVNNSGYIATAFSNVSGLLKNDVVKDVLAKNTNKTFKPSLTVVTVHAILIVVVGVLVALTPVFGKLLRKINTNVNLEYSNNLGKIDVDEE